MNEIFKIQELQNLCISITDCHHSTPEYIQEGNLVIRNYNIKNGRLLLDHLSFTNDENFKLRTAREIPEEGDLIITREAPMGEVCKIPANLKCCLGQRMVLLKPNNELVDTNFLLYSLMSKFVQTQISNSEGTGSIVSNLRIPVLKELMIPTVSLPEQRLIGSLIRSLDDKIDLNNKINSDLEQIAKTLYNYWFIQFDFPNTQDKPYKSSGGEMEYHTVLKRKIPKGWEVRDFNNLLSFTRGISYTSSTMNDQYGIPMINLKSFNLNGTYRNDGLKYFTGKINSSKTIDKDDLLIAITDVTREAEIIGRAILAPKFGVDAVCSCDVARVNILDENFSKNYLRYLFNSQHYHDYIKHFASGTLVLHLDLNGILWYTDIIPPKDLQIKFEDFVNNIDNKIQSNIRQSQELGKLRDWLLPMLMNGQIKVADAEEMINEQLDIVVQSSVNNQLNLTDKDKKNRRKMLATYIINQSLKDTSFGKTKFEKLLHLIECHIVRGDYNQRYSVQAAGPYDGGFTKLFWNEVIKAKWFKIEELGKLRRIMPAENHAKSLVDYGYLSNDLKLMINDFIEEFKNTNYERPEIISTLYAVWNNRIIRNEMITDELLKEDFLEWDAQKVKYKDRLDNGLEWMREKGIIPDGWGSEIRRAKK